MSLFDLGGRTAIVTGGGKGIGRQMAQGLAEAGANVVVCARQAERCEAAAAELERLGVRALGLRCDVRDSEQVQAVVDRAVADFGAVDILVNNAGTVTGHRLLDMADAAIEATFAINTLALYWTTRALLPGMIQRARGHIVTIASAAGLVGVARQTAYAASKHAAVGFDESLRYELRAIAPSVKTTVVCPFYVNTGMFEGVKTRFPRLLPILDEEDVARRVIRAIRRDERRVVIPPLVRLLPALRLLPAPVFDRIIDFFGVNASMDEFTGRTP